MNKTITKKGYIRRFVKLFISRTGLSYLYARENALYFATDKEDYYSDFVESDVVECIQDHL